MPTQQQIERFTLVFHHEALQRLRANPSLREQALNVLARWESNGMSPAGQSYRDRWRQLLRADIDTLEDAVCVATDEAATLRSVSPLGFLIDDDSRLRLRSTAMAQ